MVKVSKTRIIAAAAGAVFAGVVFLPAGAARAQGVDVEMGRQIWRAGANCRDCHGWAANGVQDVPQQPQGANLRATTLTPEQMAEVVRCGRPGSEMPYFGNNQWTAANRCYGMTQAEAGTMMPVKGDNVLNARQLDSLVAFIFSEYVGKPPPTFDECTRAFGTEAARCGGYPRAGN